MTLPASARMPAEWEPHERTLIGWPCRRELWRDTLPEAKADYAAVARAIAGFEPVTVIANPGADAAEARAALTGADATVLELPLDDSWLRDCGPIYVRDATGDPAAPRSAVHFGFNAWGERFQPYDRDAAVGRLAAEALGDPVRTAPLVLEGGSIAMLADGSLLTTEQCLLHPNRNPRLDRAAIEHALCDALGATRIVWLGLGLAEDRDTDGHVDLIAVPLPDGRVLLQSAPPGDPNHERGEENLARLTAAAIGVVAMPHLPRTAVSGEPVACSYLNLYVCNGAVIVPTTGAATDPDALAIIADAFPGRQVVPVPGAVLAYGGGGPHCITQQVPAR